MLFISSNLPTVFPPLSSTPFISGMSPGLQRQTCPMKPVYTRLSDVCQQGAFKLPQRAVSSLCLTYKLFCSRYSCRIILAHVGYVFRAVVRIGVHLLGDVNAKGSTEGVIAPLLIFESQMVVVIEILQRSVVLFLFGHL